MISPVLSALGWIGQRGTFALTASILIGMTLPFLSAYARPFLSEAVFVLLLLAFLRVDPSAARHRLKNPAIIVLATFWMMAVIPLGASLVLGFAPVDKVPLDVILIFFIVAAAPPVMSSPAFIYLMGLNGALSLTVLIAATALSPFTAPLAAEIMLGDGLEFDGLALALRLAGLLGGSLALAGLIRAIAGPARIVAAKSQVDGLNVLVLLFFAVAAMDGVAASFAANPLFTLGIAVLTFVVAFLQIGVTLLVFTPFSRDDAFAIAHSTGNRNMGLMVAALGGTVPELTWLWFALGQLPIYMLPMILKPLARRFVIDQGSD